MHQLVFSIRCSAPVDRGESWEVVVSQVCGHPSKRSEEGGCTFADGELAVIREHCKRCQVERVVRIARGAAAELFLADIIRLQLPERSAHGFDELDFWQLWIHDREDALAGAAAAGYSAPTPH